MTTINLKEVIREIVTFSLSDLGQVMNKVQKQRRPSRQGSNPTLTINKTKLQAAAKAAMADDSYNKQSLTRFQSFKFTVKTLHFILTVSNSISCSAKYFWIEFEAKLNILLAPWIVTAE